MSDKFKILKAYFGVKSRLQILLCSLSSSLTRLVSQQTSKRAAAAHRTHLVKESDVFLKFNFESVFCSGSRNTDMLVLVTTLVP